MRRASSGLMGRWTEILFVATAAVEPKHRTAAKAVWRQVWPAPLANLALQLRRHICTPRSRCMSCHHSQAASPARSFAFAKPARLGSPRQKLLRQSAGHAFPVSWSFPPATHLMELTVRAHGFHFSSILDTVGAFIVCARLESYTDLTFVAQLSVAHRQPTGRVMSRQPSSSPRRL